MLITIRGRIDYFTRSLDFACLFPERLGVDSRGEVGENECTDGVWVARRLWTRRFGRLRSCFFLYRSLGALRVKSVTRYSKYDQNETYFFVRPL